MTDNPWQIDRLDLDGYLARVGLPARRPSREALDELHEAHVCTFTFDNIDVLLDQHAGIGLDALNEKFVGRGRGGYCFEHSIIVAAALERLGYQVVRRLGRVGDPGAGTQQGRTHMVVEVVLDGQRLLCDPGFGMSLRRPIEVRDGAELDYLPGWRFRLRRTDEGTWALDRHRENGWEVTHTTDELPVKPVDVLMGHHFTSTYPTSHFRAAVYLTRHMRDRHVACSHEAVTIRRQGQPTEHHALSDGEFGDWLDELEVPLAAEERRRLLERVREIRPMAASQ